MVLWCPVGEVSLASEYPGRACWACNAFEGQINDYQVMCQRCVGVCPTTEIVGVLRPGSRNDVSAQRMNCVEPMRWSYDGAHRDRIMERTTCRYRVPQEVWWASPCCCVDEPGCVWGGAGVNAVTAAVACWRACWWTGRSAAVVVERHTAHTEPAHSCVCQRLYGSERDGTWWAVWWAG